MWRKSLLLLAVLINGIALVAIADEPTWGDLKMRFVYDGKPPEPKPLFVRPGAPFAPLDERWVVNPKNKGVANVVVYLVRTGGDNLPIHPDLVKPEKKSINLDVAGGRFIPRVTVLRTRQDLVITNRDPVGHSLKADFFNNQSFSDLWPTGGTVTKRLVHREASPVLLSCSIYPQMTGYLFVRDDPYVAVSDGDGNLVLPQLPSGVRTFAIFHENLWLRKAIQDGEPVEWKRGRFDVEIKAAEHDLGTFAIK